MFVQFKDAGRTEIACVLPGPQDPESFPNQSEVEDNDPVLIQFLAKYQPASGTPSADIAARTWRNAEIERVAWLRDRHRDELELSAETTISADQYAQLLAYIKALRDWPATAEFPAEDSRPEVPDWVATQTL